MVGLTQISPTMGLFDHRKIKARHLSRMLPFSAKKVSMFFFRGVAVCLPHPGFYFE